MELITFEALTAGVKFIVTPGPDPKIVTYCQSKGVGCSTSPALSRRLVPTR